MLSLMQILLMILGVVKFVMIVQIIMSWLINFQVLNVRQPLVYQIWEGLSRLLEPIYRPIRKILPPMGGLDLAPLVAFIAIYAIERIIYNNMGMFY
ncbi:YggT family protein [uncultured Celeribacter sp.]|uniref:YggT family protein n=1 Tax=uncultured Celeribacter sp. TaxID=1303376 RepID=UPI002AA6FE13|nr:YggT family protein [uncultured Celeribacter sp.]